MDSRVWMASILAAWLAGCGTAQNATSDEVRADFGHGLTGAAARPMVDTDQLPVFELFAGGRALDIGAVDAVVDTATQTLAWIDEAGVLWVAPLDSAPAGKREVAGPVIPGLAARDGRVAFAWRELGPETEPFVLDIRARQIIALDDGPGPDEVLGFSPDGDEVLVLSGRTGLASLFALGVTRHTARQLTNVGLVPGRGLDTARVTPAPANIHDVAWTARGIEYRGDDRRVVVAAEVVR